MTRAAGPRAASRARALVHEGVVPFVAGAATVAGFAPIDWWPLPIVAVAVLLAAWQRCEHAWQAARAGFAFGLGLFLGGVSWVYVSLHTFGGMPAALAALATFLFCAYLALFPAAAGALAVRAAPAGGGRRLLAAAAALAAFEWVRGWLFSGFPWLNLGTSQAPDGWLAGWAPLAGAYGTTLALALTAAAAVGAVESRRQPRAAAGWIALVVALLGGGAALRAVEWTRPDGAPVTVALLQGNVPQQIKWEESVRGRTFEQYRAMIVAAAARVVVIPETALPAFLDELPRDYIAGLREHARAAGKDILLGTVEREPSADGGRYFNSLVRITGERMQSYRKRHLVPFGEFIPPGFRWILAVLHIPMSDFTRGADEQGTLDAGGVRFGVAICYEDIFGEEVIDALPRAQALVNVSNDAWFGESFAADQHLQASQMRALESGRWMVRSTNTGASAAIDERGVVVARLPAFTQGTLIASIVPRAGATPYARFGNVPAVAAILGCLALAAFRRGGSAAGTAPRKAPPAPGA